MARHRGWRIILLAGLAGGAIAAADPKPSLQALGMIEPGQWTLQETGPKGTKIALCLGDTGMLLQLRHPKVHCDRFTVENAPMMATVHYQCPGAGEGHTTVRITSGQAIRVETQGIADSAPFDMTYDGRRVGPCPGAVAR